MATSEIVHKYGKSECFIDFTNQNEIIVNEKILQNIFHHEKVKNRKIVVFSTIGVFRKGKSFFLGYCLRYLYANYESINNPIERGSTFIANLDWMGDKDEPLAGFSWRSGAKRDTSGIRIWNDVFLHTVPSTGDKIAIILMDTQGLFDNETTPVNNSRIFALGTLMSSILVFNLSQNVQEDQLQYMQFATEFARFAAHDDDSEKSFQNLMFLIRDWPNPHEYSYGIEDGKKFMKTFLEPKASQNEALISVRKFIKRSFESISCSLMPHPGSKVASGQIKGKPYDGNWYMMEEDFREILKDTIEYLLIPDNIVIKKISGIETKGSEFYEFIVKYSKMFQSDEIPQAQSIYEATLDSQMKIIVDKCFDYYKVQIFQNVDLIETIEHVKVIHEKSKYSALIMFKEAKKMGGQNIILQFENLLVNKIDDFFKYWSDATEQNFQKIQEEMEQAQQILEEKEREYNDQVQAVEMASAKAIEIEKKKSEMQKDEFERIKTEFLKRIEMEKMRLNILEQERQLNKRERKLIEAQLRSLKTNVQEETGEVFVGIEIENQRLGYKTFIPKQIAKIFKKFKPSCGHSEEEHKKEKYDALLYFDEM